ncbi:MULTISPECIES: hypothetical protein [unclassified Thermosynechococcus]|uniref:hypothetical protein n=1 Tax=unclassified Thermosynechococcus TaxID=2622553 RepID=UPI002670E562|nr:MULTISPECIES: hypothetical protein [unclassified Thermosynechococcus]WKT83062.1 hypothetical protein QYC28_09535 [Thermosynechococcus sp. HY596]WNC62189.1 hypothetical protein RHK13_09530 [Thermosynechococcus sp. HY591]WNC64742.1 hypothetical protein RHK28_09560 [Thermosynechococcus sp. HY593]
MRPLRRSWQQESEDFNPWMSYTDLMSGSLLILSLITFFMMIFMIVNQKQVNELRKQLQTQQTVQGPPPILFIPDNEKFRFPAGSAQLSEPFRQYIWVNLASMVMDTRKKYGIDTVEIIGHTDGQPNQGGVSNLDTLLEQAVATNTLNRLTPGSNADLGLMRALAIANELRKVQAKQPQLAGLKFRAYSAGQLYLLNGQLAPANRNPDVSRRRIEVRFTRTGRTETAR